MCCSLSMEGAMAWLSELFSSAGGDVEGRTTCRCHCPQHRFERRGMALHAGIAADVWYLGGDAINSDSCAKHFESCC